MNDQDDWSSIKESILNSVNTTLKLEKLLPSKSRITQQILVSIKNGYFTEKIEIIGNTKK